MHKKFLNVGIGIGAIIIAGISFLFGIHWHGTLGDWMRENGTIKTLSCFGNNNLTETFQLDCYAPFVSSKEFVYNKEMVCHVLTNHQLSVMPDKPFYDIGLIKSDYVQFSLLVDEDKQTIQRSNTGGEMSRGLYTLVQQDDVILHGIQKNVYDDGFSKREYEYITVSKKTGRGMRMWVNVNLKYKSGNGIASDFFQCE